MPRRLAPARHHAAHSVTALFGRRLLRLPGRTCASAGRPALQVGRLAAWPAGQAHGSAPWRGLPAPRAGSAAACSDPWHYWWQAHYVDCLVDAGRRELADGATPAARFNGPDHASAGQPGLPAGHAASGCATPLRSSTTTTTTWPGWPWPPTGWTGSPRRHRQPGRRRNARVRRSLTLQFDAACTDDLGGGVFWSKKRDFKNTPATAPVALYYARTGQPAKAQALMDWLDATLFDAGPGPVPGRRPPGPAGEVLVERDRLHLQPGPGPGRPAGNGRGRKPGQGGRRWWTRWTGC